MDLVTVKGQAFDFDFNESEITIDLMSPYPVITFSDELENNQAKGSNRDLVVHLLSQKIELKALEIRLKELWNMANFSLLNLMNDYFLASFSYDEGYYRALIKGPWVVLRSYLQIQPWHLSFDVATNVMESVVVWIRLPGLSLHLYNNKILHRIGSSIGKLVKIDETISMALRGKYGRMAVSLNLNKSLVSKVDIKGRVQLIEYENLP